MPEENCAALFAHCIDSSGSRACVARVYNKLYVFCVCVCVFCVRSALVNRRVNVLPTCVLAVTKEFEALRHKPDGSGFGSRWCR